jgi:hypothetical protein
MCHRGSQGPFPRSQEIPLLSYLNLARNLNPTRPGKIRTKCVQNEYTFQNAKSVNAVVIAAYDKKHAGFPFDGQKTRPKPDRFQTKKGGEGPVDLVYVGVSSRLPGAKRIKANKSEWKIKFVAKNFPVHCTEVNVNEQK